MAKKDAKKVPVVRFKGFTEDWNQREVGNFLTESKIPGTNGKEAKKITVKLWRKGVIEKRETYNGSEATKYYTRKSGQFMYGKLNFLNQAFGIIPEWLDGYESTLDSPAFDIVGLLNPVFFLEYISRRQFYLYQGTLANGSRNAKRIYVDTFFEMPLLVPRKAEQDRIAAFFNLLDSSMDLNQQKLDLLNKLKKELLQRMFPQKGEVIPKIRFSNFTDDWEQRKLGDLVKVTTGKAFRSTDFSENGEFLVVTNKNIQDSEKGIVSLGDRIDIPNQAELEKYRLNGENILVTMDGVNIGKTGLYSDSQAVIAQRVGRLSGGQISFVYQLTKKDDFLDSMNKISVGNAIKHISLAQIANYTALVPKQEQEQQQIGAFFKQLDHTITLHQRKLEQLKNLKKKFLQEMFV